MFPFGTLHIGEYSPRESSWNEAHLEIFHGDWEIAIGEVSKVRYSHCVHVISMECSTRWFLSEHDLWDSHVHSRNWIPEVWNLDINVSFITNIRESSGVGEGVTKFREESKVYRTNLFEGTVYHLLIEIY
jgi:hypothetical protein